VAQASFPQCANGARIVPYSCIINAQSFVDVDGAHVDYEHTEVFWGFTSIWYPHQTWDVHWAGATAFTDDAETDILASVLPFPGRLALFDSAMRHMSTPATAVSQPLGPDYPVQANTRILGNRFSYTGKWICTNATDDEVFARLDQDEDGFVDLDEISRSVEFPDPKFPPMKLVGKDKHALQDADVDADTKFSKSEIKQLLNKNLKF
jgi:hypothetical protein